MIINHDGKKYEVRNHCDQEPVYRPVGYRYRLNEFFVSEKLPFGWRIINSPI